MKRWFKDYWMVVVFAAIGVALITVAIIAAANGGSSIDNWSLNPANPASPVRQMMP